MNKAVFSRLDLNDLDNNKSLMYNDCIKDISAKPDFHKLDNFKQHMNTSRLQHSVNVSYYSFLMCKALGLNYKAAARAGLLHDLYYYNWRAVNHSKSYHAKAHPKAALDNARRLADLSLIEQDAIVNHMWPITVPLPRYKESYVVSLMDKYCTCCEVICSCAKKIIVRKHHSATELI